MAKVTKRQRTKVDKALDKLLAERRVSTGGYAPVTDEDLEQLHVLMYAIIEAKWGEDPDGDLPIEYKVVNRQAHERMHYAPIPYKHKINNFEGIRNWLSLLVMNLDMAQEAVSKAMRSFMEYDMPRIGLTYQNWYKGGRPPHQPGHYWAWSRELFKGSQVIEVRYGQPSTKPLVVRLPGQDDQIPLDKIDAWGPEVLNYGRGPLPWKEKEDPEGS